MPSKDLHDKPFDQGTLAKLEIFEDYAQAWIPTWVMASVRNIYIFDFFAGTGLDKNGVPGSPIRILQKIKEQISIIKRKKVCVHLYFNEYDLKKFQKLKVACSNFLIQNPEVESGINLTLLNDDFEAIFQSHFNLIKAFPSLVFLDQNGIKFLTLEYIQQFGSIRSTDFLYFVSSSSFLRFGKAPEFKKYFDFDLNAAKKDPYNFIHRHLINQIKQKLNSNSRLKLYPYTIKKRNNVYGLIFGATHPIAVDKFLNISWKRNEINGEADFDLDEDAAKSQLNLFETKKLTKIEKFRSLVQENVLAGKITDNFELYSFTLGQGHVGKHAATEIRALKENKKIDYVGVSPLVNYDNVHRKKKRVVFKVLKKWASQK